MKRAISVFILFFMVLHANGKLPGHLSVTARGGLSFPGISSEGSSFSGRSFAVGLTYNPYPEAKIGMQSFVGLASNAYRHYFDDAIFVEHIQKGITSDLCAWLPIGERCRVLVGINVFLPFRSMVDMGEKRFNETHFYSNDSMLVRYKRSSFEAGAVVAFDCSLGQRKQSHFGVRIAQDGNSPVREDAVYTDASGNALTISRKMKPASAQIYFSVRIIPREKRKEKLLE